MGSDENKGAAVVYGILLSFGIAMLLAYNSFISSPDYVNKYYQYASGNPNATTSMPNAWENMMTYIVITSMIPNFILQTYVVSPHGQGLSIHKRLMISIVALTVSVLIVLILPACKPNEKVAMGMFLFGVAISGAAAAFFQSSSFGLASMLPANNIQATMLGIGISGAATSLLRIIIKAAVGNSDFEGTKQQANMFYGIAVGWLVICFVMAAFLPRIPYLRNRIPEFGGSLDFGIQEALTAEDPEKDSSREMDPLASKTSSRGSLQVVRRIWPLMLANFLVYVTSLMLFPQLCSNADPNNSWFGEVVIFLFNFGDTCGRFLCRFPRLHLPRPTLLPASIARIVFIPLVILCVHPKVIHGDAAPYIFMYLVGISNGFVSSLCMMNGPATPTLLDNERAVAGSAMSLSLLGGCSAGSLLALLVNNYVTPQ